MADLPPPHIVLDSCCVINLYASGRMRDILLSFQAQFVIAEEAIDHEILWVLEGTEKTKIDLSPFVEDETIEIVALETEDEENTVVNLATQLDDGEAISAAIAFHRSWGLATDDKKARQVLGKLFPRLHMISTPEIIKHWVDGAAPSKEEVLFVLRRIESSARFEPARDHPLFSWWSSFTVNLP